MKFMVLWKVDKNVFNYIGCDLWLLPGAAKPAEAWDDEAVLPLDEQPLHLVQDPPRVPPSRI